MPSSTSIPSSHTIPTESSAVLGVAGESSLAAHSAFASKFVHQVAMADPFRSSGSEMKDTLDTLSHVVATLREQTVANEMKYPHARPTQRPRPSGYELPPIQKAVELIRIANSKCRGHCDPSCYDDDLTGPANRSAPGRNRVDIPVHTDATLLGHMHAGLLL